MLIASYAFASIVFYFIVLAIHECSHILIPWSHGWRVEISLLPSWSAGRFTFGHATWQKEKHSREIQNKGWVYIAPRISNLFFIVILAFCDNNFIKLFQVFMAIDFIFNTIPIFISRRPNDAWLTAEGFKWNIRLTRLASFAACGIVAGIVFFV